MKKRIAFQGARGAYSDIACRTCMPDAETLPCFSFEDAFKAVLEGQAAYALLPVENSVAGRVADVHQLMPSAGLYIIGEHFQPIEHHLLGLQDAELSDIREVHSHVQALSQCRDWLYEHNIRPIVCSDTAGGAEEIAKLGDKTKAGLASELAGVVYGLKSLAADIADQKGNTTRFLLLADKPRVPDPGIPCITTMIFRVRSVPAALYKALGGFATNKVNLTKIESYLVNNRFTAAQFYVDVEGRPDEEPLANAIDELTFFAHEIKILGTYPAHPYRLEKK
jgi:prephenate dehydratase